MKKYNTFFYLLIFWISGFAQTPCPPELDGILPGDYPPGCTICSPLLEGSTKGYTPDSLKYDFPCGLVENSQWISLIADSTGLIAISVSTSNCLSGKGVEFALFDEQLDLVSICETSTGTNDPAPQINASNLTPGGFYHLMIDGIDGDECDIQVVQAGGSGNNFPMQPVRIAADPLADRYCPGAEVCFSIDRMPGAYEYIWEGPDNLDSISGGGLLDTFYCVEFNNVGGGILTVTPNFDCGAGVPSITPAIALPILPTILTLMVCADELPIKFASREFDHFGRYRFIIDSELGCDSLIDLTLAETIIIPESIDTTICEGTCVQIQDSCYWESTSDLDLHCLLIDELNISFIDSFPAPEIECNFNNANRNFSWNEVVGAEAYLILINGDTFTTQTWTNFRILSLPADSQITIQVQPIANNNCIFKAAELTCPESTSSSEVFVENSLIVFPNPSRGKFTVQSTSIILEIGVFDLSGKEIFRTQNAEIDLINGNSGIYFLKIRTKEGVFLKKVVRI